MAEHPPLCPFAHAQINAQGGIAHFSKWQLHLDLVFLIKVYDNTSIRKVSNTDKGNVKDGLYYLFVIVTLVVCIAGAWINVDSLLDLWSGQGYSDYYIFLEPKKAVFYSIFWGLIFAALMVLMCANAYSRKRWVVVKIGLLAIAGIFICGLIYRVLTDFREP